MAKNFRRIPDRIRARLNRVQGNDLVVSCLLRIPASKLTNNEFSHLGISLNVTGLHYPDCIIPNASQGKHSNKNVNGEEIVRKDLPKIIRNFYMEAPDWKGYSTNTVCMQKEVYRRDFISPRLASICMESSNIGPGLNEYSILFKLDEVLSRNAQDFEERLLDLLNILQENINCADVNSSTSTYQDYLTSIQLAWEILPPGQRGTFIQRILAGNTNPNQNTVVQQRVNFLLSLNPTDLILGSSGLQRYWGVKLRDDLVIFENIRYGNAIYMMYDNWNVLSQRSRTEILSGTYGNNFDRVPHTTGWENTVRQIIRSRP